jgi:hypothetical protein
MECAIDGCTNDATKTPRIKLGPKSWTIFMDRSVCDQHTKECGDLFEQEKADAEANETELCIQTIPTQVALRQVG